MPEIRINVMFRSSSNRFQPEFSFDRWKSISNRLDGIFGFWETEIGTSSRTWIYAGFTYILNYESDLSEIIPSFKEPKTKKNYLAHDPTCSLLKYCALIEAKYGDDLITSRKMWMLIRMLIGLVDMTVWVDIFEFEIRFGNRESLMQGVNCSSNYYPSSLNQKVVQIPSADENIEAFK